MKIALLLTPITMLVTVLCCGCTGESATAEPQQWSFEPNKVWEIHQIAGEDLLRPAEPRIADDGTLYFHDFERHLSYIVDGDGELVNTFAPRGDGEGAVPMYLNCFPAGDQAVICGMSNLYFFTNRGEFVSSIPNNPFLRFPLAFKGAYTCWMAPGALGDSPESLAVVTRIDWTTNEETTTHEFTRTEVESKPTGGAVVVGLTPQIKMGYDRKSDRVYFGKNSDTVVYWSDCASGKTGTFSFTGIPHPVSETDKRNHFARFDIPEEAIAALIGMLPDQMAYYNRIQAVNGLVYLFGTESIGHALTGQDIDIYAPDGRHLYHGRIDLEPGWHITGPDNLQLADGFMYVIQQNDAGQKKVAKYSIAIPRS